MNHQSTFSTSRFSTYIVLQVAIATAALAADKPKQQLLDLESQIATAVIRKDKEFIQRVFGDDFVYTGVRGEMKRKEDILTELTSGKLKFTELKFDNQQVRIYGEAAIVTGRATTKGQSPQGEIRGAFRYTRVYIQRDGRWQLVAFQGTPIRQESSKRK